ncbi:hypothetical protein tb265_23890 [Gemmatimonadetes bacterium T265]|nr:hypothetical protein tb265_23890 [Gemmatimonadetes bacterium T265]
MTESTLVRAAEFGVHLPAALLRWWVAPWPALPATRDAALQTAVSVGGALLVAYAAWAHTAHRASATQVRGVGAAGVGFLLSAYASASLRGHPVLGPAVSLVGVALVFRASVALVRERQDARAHALRKPGARDLPGGGPPTA